MAKTIFIQGGEIRREALANAAITPGDLIELISTGKVQRHANAGRNAAKLFAVEDDLQGNGIDDAYAASNQCLYAVARPGDVVYAWLADGQNVAIGDFLESAAAGSLRKVVSPTATSAGALDASEVIYQAAIVGVALEAVNLSGSANLSARGRIKVLVV